MEDKREAREGLRVVTDNTKSVVSCFDYSLLLVVIFLAVFGIVMIYSSGSYRNSFFGGDYKDDLNVQLISVGIGIVLMLITSFIDYRFFYRRIRFVGSFSNVIYFGVLVLVILVFFFGKSVNGATRWIKLGIFQFQPSELSKVAIILFVSEFAARNRKVMDSFKGPVLIIAYCLPLIICVGLQTLSTAIIITVIAYGICYVSSKKRMRFILVAVIALAVLIAVIVLLPGFRSERISVWLDIENPEYANGTGRQVLQGLYAISNGGFFGKGFGNGTQKLTNISDVQNDMIFTAICEELGLFGAIAVLLLFAMLLYRLYKIAVNAPDTRGSYIAVGIMIHIAVQVIINVAVVTNSMPNTGVTLPFISAGGTSVIMLMIEMGVALNISRQSDAVA